MGIFMEILCTVSLDPTNGRYTGLCVYEAALFVSTATYSVCKINFTTQHEAEMHT